MLPRKRPNLFIVPVVLGLLAAGCATRPLSGVSVKNLTSDLVFGVPPVSEAVAPPNTLPGGDATLLADLDESGTAPVFRRSSQAPEPDPCPIAPVGSAPLDSVPQSIASPPRTGVYDYRYVVQFPKSSFRFEGFEKRGIGNVRRFEDRDVNENDPESARFDFRFTMTQELVGSSYQVLSASVFGVDQSSTNVNPTGPSAFKGENPRGIYLLTIEQTINERGKVRQRKFNANPPIKYMTLPGIIGAEGAFSTTSVDPTTQSVISFQGETIRRQPVDACGEMIDTWYMNATQRFTPPDGQTVETKLEYGIATQFGGMIVIEHFEVPAASPDSILDFAIGSISPK